MTTDLKKEIIMKNQSIRNLQSQMNEKEIQNTVEQVLGRRYNNKQKHLIVIQGSSSSGKSTLANNIFNLFVENGIECFLLEIDKFYKTYDWGFGKGDVKKRLSQYDFDNPAAIDWEKVNAVLKAIENEDDYVPLYEYSFITKVCNGPIMMKNNFPKIVIMEGIYAFNSINDYVFDLKKFDPHDSSRIIQNQFVKNCNLLTQFNILKIRLAVCKSKSLEIRVARDIIERNKTKEEAIKQFENQVWPATIKWVNNECFKEDIKIIHGSFNDDKIKMLVSVLSKYFLNKSIKLKAIAYNKDLKEPYKIGCSKECNFLSSAKIVLKDD